MLYLILLSVVAALLFSFQHRLGVVGGILGYIFMFMAVATFLTILQNDPAQIFIAVLVLIVLVGGFFLFAWVREPHEIAKINSEMRREWEAELPADLTPAERAERIAEIHRLFPIPPKRSLMRH